MRCSRSSARPRCSRSASRFGEAPAGGLRGGGSCRPSRSPRTTSRSSSSPPRQSGCSSGSDPAPGRLCVADPGGASLAHVPLVLDQRGNGEAVAGSSLTARIAGIPKNLVVATASRPRRSGALSPPCSSSSGSCSPYGSPRRSSGALVAGSLAAAVVLVPFSSRPSASTSSSPGTRSRPSSPPRSASVPAMRPAGSASRRRPRSCALSRRGLPRAALDTTYGRTDWRGAAEVLRDAECPRAIVVTPFMNRSSAALPPWPPRARARTARGRPGDRKHRPGHRGWVLGGRDRRRRPWSAPKPVDGFRVVSVDRKPTYTLVRYRADRPTPRPARRPSPGSRSRTSNRECSCRRRERAVRRSSAAGGASIPG